MPSVELSDQEWGQLVALLANNCVWAQVNPLLMKIGQQIEAQRQAPNRPMQMQGAHANSEDKPGQP